MHIFLKMPDSIPFFTAGISLITAVVTFLAFENPLLFQRFLFSSEDILKRREYYRMFSSALLHADWFHFLFNIWAFYSFGKSIELNFNYGGAVVVLIYLASVFGGSLLSLFIHRGESYIAVGASGGVCGIIYARIFLLPGGSLFVFPIPVPIPDYVFAVGFLVVSSIAFQRGRSRIGHDAHIGGAIVGLVVALLLYPSLVLARPGLLALVSALSVGISLFLLRDSILPNWRRRKFVKASLPEDEPLHHCVVCGRSEKSNPELEFRVARNGHDYCLEHLPKTAPK